jgi:hypothetical protein
MSALKLAFFMQGKVMMTKKFLINIFVLFVLTTLIFSCKNESRFDVPASELPHVNVHVKRYGKALFEADTSRLKQELIKLQKQFPVFLNGNLDDTANFNQLYRYVTDTQIIKIYQKTIEVYPDLNNIEKQLSGAFSHLKYYFPEYKIPGVYSYVSDIYFEQPVIKTDTLLIIALDDYLGKDCEFYPVFNIPRYKIRCMTPANVVVDAMKEIYSVDFYQGNKTHTVLDRMIERGKQLYFLDITMPRFPDTLKICYTKKQLEWMETHKKDAWAALVGNKLLYSTQFEAIRELTEEGPFSKGFGNNSAPAIGTWFGWQIVRTFMEKNRDITPEQLFKMNDAQKILEQSGYKP